MELAITQITMMEISEAERQALLKQREAAARHALIEEKAKEVCRLLNEIETLGGRVRASRNGKNRYLRQGSSGLYCAQASGCGLDFRI